LVLGDEKNRNSSKLSLKEKFPDWDWDYWEAQIEGTDWGKK
jgi:hypothetical protein